MRITYDAQIFWRQRYGGISRYVAEVAERLARRPGLVVRVLAPIHYNEYLASARSGLVTGWTTELPQPLFRFRGVANAALSWLALRLRPADIVHETYYSARRLAPRSSRVVLTVYDMIHELRPGDFAPADRTAALKRLAVERADHVICISEHTRSDLLRLLPVNPAKVSVIHLGPALRASALDSPHPFGGAPFIMFVGDRRRYKNFAALLDAYARSAHLRGAFRLLAFGGGAFTEQELTDIGAHRLDARLVCQEHGDDATLAARYGQAAALVYPSLYEGFGIPPLEAMTLGCPVIAARASSIPEVVGDAAELFDPANPGSLGDALHRVLLDDAHAADLRTRGRVRAAQFSWERCAAETLAVYAALLREPAARR